MADTCKCNMFRDKGICWHTGFYRNPESRTQIQQAVHVQTEHTTQKRQTPEAVKRMWDYLDYCEEVKPGSSGLSGI